MSKRRLVQVILGGMLAVGIMAWFWYGSVTGSIWFVGAIIVMLTKGGNNV